MGHGAMDTITMFECSDDVFHNLGIRHHRLVWRCIAIGKVGQISRNFLTCVFR